MKEKRSQFTTSFGTRAYWFTQDKSRESLFKEKRPLDERNFGQYTSTFTPFALPADFFVCGLNRIVCGLKGIVSGPKFFLCVPNGIVCGLNGIVYGLNRIVCVPKGVLCGLNGMYTYPTKLYANSTELYAYTNFTSMD